MIRSILKKILLATFSILLCLLFGEAGIRATYHYFLNYQFEMWRYAVEMKQPLPSEELPFQHVPNRGGRYYGVEIKTNSLGLRDNEYSILKPAGRKRMIFLGDSFTLGWGVRFNSIFSKQLERTLNKSGNGFDVINMGVGNYNTQMEVELFKRDGLKLEPDMVVLMYFINDTEPTPRVSPLRYNIIKRSFLLGNLIERIRMLALISSKNDGLMAYYRQLYSEDSSNMAVNKDARKELRRLCQERNIVLLIVNIPDLRRLNNYPFSFATDSIRAFSKETNTPFLDLLPVFEKYKGESLWVSREDPHMNSEANSLAADAIYEKIMKDGLLDR